MYHTSDHITQCVHVLNEWAKAASGHCDNLLPDRLLEQDRFGSGQLHAMRGTTAGLIPDAKCRRAI